MGVRAPEGGAIRQGGPRNSGPGRVPRAATNTARACRSFALHDTFRAMISTRRSPAHCFDARLDFFSARFSLMLLLGFFFVSFFVS
jgi:hypothetical protein